VKLIIQPDAGTAPILAAIKRARKTIDVLIFRLDSRLISDALAAAVKRGVAVRALIAHTNSGGEKGLRKLEMQLLEAGVTVARSANDLLRYHGKMMIVDRRLLQLYGFNFTSLDVTRSRSFGIETRDRRFVGEAVKLFEADSARQPYAPGFDRFVVSPNNARELLSAFISGARRQLLIYDPKISDPAFVRLLDEQAWKGIDVRIIGKINGSSAVSNEKYAGKRLHVRVIVRDGTQVFLGSQSLRRAELERRREVGLIVDNKTIARELHQVFENDWAMTIAGKQIAAEHEESNRVPSDRKTNRLIAAEA
jgi:phosphatidylserine/phosphatidylglycerophosphate/cardiolipin synthase-like enzyme